MRAHDHSSKLVRPVRELNMLPWWATYLSSTLKTEIAEKRREVKQRIKEKQKELDELKQSLDTLKVRTTAAGANMSGWIDKRDKHALEIKLYSYMNGSD